MKTLLLVGGTIFLLLGVVLIIAAIIAAVLARKKVSATIAPSSPPLPVQPPATPVFVPPPTDATLVVSLARPESGGAGALYGISGSVQGRSFSIPADGFFVGREETLAQIVIADHRVSKRHVWIGMKNGVILAVDQDSTNGTFLNQPGARISEASLKPGDVLIISDDVARLEYRR